LVTGFFPINTVSPPIQKSSRLTRYGLALNTHDVMKIAAISLMVVDHIGFYFLADNLWFRLIGRGAAPLFFFLIGYAGKLHLTWMLVLYGCALSISGFLVNGLTQINILLTFVALHFALRYFPAEKLGFIARMIMFIFCSILTVFTYDYIEYGLLGFLIGYSGRFIALKENFADLWLIAALAIYFIWECLNFGFNVYPKMLIVFSMFIVTLYVVMSRFRQATLPCPTWLLTPLLVLSRYSLEIYFFHLIALQSYRFLQIGANIVQ